MRIDASKLRVAAGGETIASVLGRPEEQEYPQYSQGAFGLGGCMLSRPQDPALRYHVADMLRDAVAATDNASACDVFVEEPTLFVTRYEYANLYHTMTDWHAAWAALHAVRLLEERVGASENGARITRPLPHRIVFLDGHAQGLLDPVWKTLFTPNITYISTMPTGTCFRQAVFVHAGYTSPIYDWPDDCGLQSSVKAFGAFVLGQHGLLGLTRRARQTAFVFRDPYVAHPRNPGGGAGRMVGNVRDIEAALRDVAAGAAVMMHAVNMTFTEQLRVIRTTHVLTGMHGAGLTHALFLPPGAALLELQPTSHLGMTHFQNFARWGGARYEQLVVAQEQGEAYNISRVELTAALARTLSGPTA
jgi:glycoprotein 2-beta-D-xylosyltransferase